MGWEKRTRGGLYYTRSQKANGHVLREYVGGGALGALAAKMDALKRLQREEEVQALREECLRMEALQAPLEELCEAVEALSRATLLAAGYRLHKRGEWRKKREGNKERP
jgi:hypothetical protein